MHFHCKWNAFSTDNGNDNKWGTNKVKRWLDDDRKKLAKKISLFIKPLICKNDSQMAIDF